MIQKLITFVGKMSGGQFVGATFGAMCAMSVLAFLAFISPVPTVGLIPVIAGFMIPPFAFVLRCKSYDQKNKRN